MLRTIKNFFTEEDGMGVIEVVVIIAVLVGLALLFRTQISKFAGSLMKKVFDTNTIPTGELTGN